MQLIKFNDQVTFVDSNDNTHLLRIGDHITEEQFKKLFVSFRNNTLKDDDVLVFIYPDIAKKAELSKMLNELNNIVGFTKKDGALYRNNIPISMPELLIRKYYQAVLENDNDAINAMDNFWLLCALNPDPQARQDLFPFLQRNGFHITNSGYFIGYRNVDIKSKGDEKLHNFINAEYFKIKRWKKSPAKRWVVEEDNGTYTSITDNEYMTGENLNVVGNLEQLYDNPHYTQTVYTDSFSRTFTIRIGTPVKQKRSECDPNPNNLCSKGLHIGAAEWLERNYFGGTGIICLINPMDCVAVPNEQHYGKMRVCSYYPYALVEWDDNNKVITPDHTSFEEDYTEYVLDDLNKMLAESDVTELSINNFDVTEIQFNAIQRSLEDISNIVSNKISELPAECKYCGKELTSAWERIDGTCEECEELYAEE